MSVVAHLDFETRSACDLKKAGVHRYAEHPTTQIVCMSWCIGDGPVFSWVPGEPDPVELLDHVRGGGIVAAHNMQFDRTIWNYIATSWGWPQIRISQTDCTMARANAMGLPAALGMVGSAIGARLQKDAEGGRLMMQMCKPRATFALNSAEGQAALAAGGSDVEAFPALNLVVKWWFDEARLTRLRSYCDTDILSEREIDDALPQLSNGRNSGVNERDVYWLDQTINQRGVAIDKQLAEKAAAVALEARKRADERMWWLTDGAVKKCSEVAKLVAWLNGRGIACESVAKGDIEDIILQSEVLSDETAEEAVRLRRQTSRTSTDKFKAMLASVCEDGRVRGTLAYHSAHTGRWAGRLIQPQNFPRVDPDHELPDVMRAIGLLKSDRDAEEIASALHLLTGDVMGTLAKCLRATLVAPTGRKFVGGDFSNVEGRINAWIAGEAWKLQAFREYDEGTGPDLYKLAFSKSFNVGIDKVSKADRQIGKVMELALGYQGGVGAFQTMASNYGVKVTDERANELKGAWRAANSAITQSWWDMQDAAIAAVGTPGEKIEILSGRVVYLAANGFLYCRLPSGRVISYAAPRLVVAKTAQGRERYQVEYDGLDSQTNRWGPIRLYGGSQCNHIVQGTARDVMAEAMFRAEGRGFPVVLTVHDELLSEIAENNKEQADEFAALMAQLPSWAEGLPLAAAAWEDTRYVK